MDAIISGRAGVAVLVKDEVYSSFDVEDPATPRPRRPADLRLLFGEATDLEFFEDVDHAVAARHLEHAFDCASTLDLALILLDPELTDDLRDDAAEELERLLSESPGSFYLRQVLFAKPLPAAADLAGALTRCTGGRLPQLSFVLRYLEAHQPVIRAVRAAWDNLPLPLFGGDEQKAAFQRAAVRAGLFYLLTIFINLNLRRDEIESKLPRLASTASLSTDKYEEIIREWVETARRRHILAEGVNDGAERTRQAVKPETRPAREPNSYAFPGLVYAALGVALFAYCVWGVGFNLVLQDVFKLGAGFLLVLLISCVRPFARAVAWKSCFERPHRLRLRDALRAHLIGEAVGDVLPNGGHLGGAAKVALVRERVPVAARFSAVAAERTIYVLSVALLFLLAAVTFLVKFQDNFPKTSPLIPLSRISLLVIFMIVVSLIDGVYVYRLAKFQPERLAGVLDRFGEYERRFSNFNAGSRSRLLLIFFLEVSAHLAGAIEVYVILYLISPTPPPWHAALMLETANRVVHGLFAFVPMRIGVAEAATIWLAGILGLGSPTGVSLAIVRRVINVVWTTAGVALLIRRGLSPRAALREALATSRLSEVEKVSTR